MKIFVYQLDETSFKITSIEKPQLQSVLLAKGEHSIVSSQINEMLKTSTLETFDNIDFCKVSKNNGVSTIDNLHNLQSWLLIIIDDHNSRIIKNIGAKVETMKNLYKGSLKDCVIALYNHIETST